MDLTKFRIIDYKGRKMAKYGNGEKFINLNNITINKILKAQGGEDLKNVVFENSSVVYDNTEHELIATNIPEGITVEYTNNTATSIGVYNAKATFTKEGKIIGAKSATLTIIAPNVDNILFDDKTVTYDGNEHEVLISGELSNVVEVVYENNKGIEVGTYNATAKLVTLDNTVIKTMTAKLTIVEEGEEIPSLDNVIFEDAEFLYDGEEHEIIATNIPEGVTVTYENNKLTEVGSLESKANFFYKDNKIKTMSATLTIILPNVDDISFENKVVKYDGNEHEVLISGTLPENVEVIYTNNKGTEVGTYDATAKLVTFSKEIKTLNATLTISENDEIPSLDGVIFEDEEIVFDGEEHGIFATNVPDSIDVEYGFNTFSNIGIHEVTSTYKYKGTILEHKKANLTILTPDVSNITFEDKILMYDGEEHEVLISGELPKGMTVVYRDNKGKEPTWLTATAKLIAKDSEVKELSCQLKIIGLDDVKFEDKERKYDTTTHTIIATNYASELEVTYEDNKRKEIGVSLAKANFTLFGEAVGTKTAKLTVFAPSFEDAIFEDETVEYDGEEHELIMSGKLPLGTLVKYENNKGTEVGIYNAKAIFQTEVTIIEEREAKLSIVPNISGIEFGNEEHVYDGEVKQILATNIPNNIEVEYINNDNSNVGYYDVRANFYYVDGDEKIFINFKEAILTITPDITEILFNDETIVYDGKEHVKLIDSEQPDYINIEYFNHINKELGEHEVKAEIFFIFYDHEPMFLGTKFCTVTIELPNINVDNLSFDDKSVEYDGGEHSIELIGDLPTELTMTQTDKKYINPGNYDYVCTLFYLDKEYHSYNAVLTIQEPIIENLVFDSKSVEYDGNEHELISETELPIGIFEEYKNNKGIEIGIYEAELYLYYLNDENQKIYLSQRPSRSTSDEELDIRPYTTANLVIHPSIKNITFDDKNVEYNGDEQEIVISGELPENVNVSYFNNKGTDIGTYNAVAYLSLEINDHSESITELSAVLTITEVDDTPDLSDVEIEHVFEYDGTQKHPKATKYPDNVSVDYGHVENEIGEYDKVVKFTYFKDGKEVLIKEINVKLIITPKYSDVTFSDSDIFYDGNVYPIAIDNPEQLPDSLSIVYENNDNKYPGEYEVVANIMYKSNILLKKLTAKLTIELPGLEDILYYSSELVTYDGNEHHIDVDYIPEGFEVEYEGDRFGTEIGQYLSKATFYYMKNNEKIVVGEFTALMGIVGTNVDELSIILINATKEDDGTYTSVDGQEVTGKISTPISIQNQNIHYDLIFTYTKNVNNVIEEVPNITESGHYSAQMSIEAEGCYLTTVMLQNIDITFIVN